VKSSIPTNSIVPLGCHLTHYPNHIPTTLKCFDTNGPLLHYIMELAIISFNDYICTSMSTKYNLKIKEPQCLRVQILENMDFNF